MQKWDKWIDEDSRFELANDYYARTLYYMNFKGKIVKKIEKGKRGF